MVLWAVLFTSVKNIFTRIKTVENTILNCRFFQFTKSKWFKWVWNSWVGGKVGGKDQASGKDQGRWKRPSKHVSPIPWAWRCGRCRRRVWGSDRQRRESRRRRKVPRPRPRGVAATAGRLRRSAGPRSSMATRPHRCCRRCRAGAQAAQGPKSSSRPCTTSPRRTCASHRPAPIQLRTKRLTWTATPRSPARTAGQTC